MGKVLLGLIKPVLKFLLGLSVVDKYLDELDKKAKETETDVDDVAVGQLRLFKDNLLKNL